MHFFHNLDTRKRQLSGGEGIFNHFFINTLKMIFILFFKQKLFLYNLLGKKVFKKIIFNNRLLIFLTVYFLIGTFSFPSLLMFLEKPESKEEQLKKPKV